MLAKKIRLESNLSILSVTQKLKSILLGGNIKATTTTTKTIKKDDKNNNVNNYYNVKRERENKKSQEEQKTMMKKCYLYINFCFLVKNCLLLIVLNPQQKLNRHLF